MAEDHQITDKHLEKVICFSNEMLELADLGDNYRVDDGCGVVFGTLRDYAYKIRNMAQNELKRHTEISKSKKKSKDS